MKIAEEIGRLEALHKSGTLNEQEFAKAKAARFLTHAPRQSANRKIIRWAIVIADISLSHESRQWRAGLDSGYRWGLPPGRMRKQQIWRQTSQEEGATV